MSVAARAIIIQGNKMLLMHRDKNGKTYFTLVGGQLKATENPEQALAREVMEETGLTVTSCRLVYFEEHPEPYNHQYIYLCEVAPHGEVALQEASEEALMNKLSTNYHRPLWVNTASFATLPFMTIQLQEAIVNALKKGFPEEPIRL